MLTSRAVDSVKKVNEIPVEKYPVEEVVVGKKSRYASIAGYLRVIGAVAVALSGVIYMLQGLESIDNQLRDWGYLALMLILGAGGVFSARVMGDNKGARLFFALAVLLVPVQYTQLGGLALDFFNPGLGQTAISPKGTTLTMFWLLFTGACSVVLSTIVSYAGFSILSRPYAKVLTGTFLLSNITLLFTVREMPWALLPLLALCLLFAYLHKKHFTQDNLFVTIEGIATQFLFATPVVVMLIRSGFYLDNVADHFFFFLSVTTLSLLLSARNSHRSVFFEIGLFISFILGLGTLILGADFIDGELLKSSTDELLIFLGGAVFWSGVFSFWSRRCGSWYRLCSQALMLYLVIQVGLDQAWLGYALMLLASLGFLSWGLYAKLKLPVLMGVILGIYSVVMLIGQLVDQVHVNTWFGLALLGVACVLFSSVLERQGKRWLQWCEHSTGQFLSWSY